MTCPPILIAGIGNIFLGDDAFGVEVAQQLARRPLPAGVRVVDFGIRGLALAYALLEHYETVILVDATPRGGLPGTLYLLEPDIMPAGAGSFIEAHNMDPVRVLQHAVALGSKVRQFFLVGCEPGSATETEGMGLSEPVRAATVEAVALVEQLVARLHRGEKVGP